MPDSAISSCHIDKHGTGLLFCLKRILNVLLKQCNLVHSRLFVSKSSLFLWKQGVDFCHDCRVAIRGSCKGRRAERWDGSSLGLLQVLRAHGIATTSALLQTFGILSWRKQEERKPCSQNFKPGLAWTKGSGQIELGPGALPGVK